MEENWGNESKEQATQYGGGSYGNSNLEEPMTMGDWFLTIILQSIPCVGAVLLIYWAFSSNVKKSKQNYCRVALIFLVIFVVLYFILGAAIVSMFASMSNQMYY